MFQDSAVAFLMLALVGTYAQFDDITISNPTVLTVNSTDEIPSIPNPSGYLEVYALPVGQGDCTIIQCPKGQLVVNDCGSSPGSRGLSAEEVKAFLGNRIENVVAIIITHPDRDHFNYLCDMPWTTSVQKVIIGATPQDYKGEKINKWLRKVNNDGKLFMVHGGQKCIGDCTLRVDIDFCNDKNINFNILAANIGPKSNQKSIVMKITSSNLNAKAFTVLLSGDMEGEASTTIATTLQGQLQSDVYKISHHGASDKANKLAWLKPIAPQMAFASSGYNYGICHHPRCDTIGRLLILNTLVAADPHTIYCGTKKDPFQLLGITQHIYETSPAFNTICYLRYTHNCLFNPVFTQTCFDKLEPSGVGGCVIEPSVGLEDDECCPVMEPSVGLEDDECSVMEPSL